MFEGKHLKLGPSFVDIQDIDAFTQKNQELIWWDTSVRPTSHMIRVMKRFYHQTRLRSMELDRLGLFFSTVKSLQIKHCSSSTHHEICKALFHITYFFFLNTSRIVNSSPMIHAKKKTGIFFTGVVFIKWSLTHIFWGGGQPLIYKSSHFKVSW